jgi:asparagine N-glycosylation enzyme membrane subunit Stt3
MLGTILVALIAFISIMIPGFLLALALLRKTELNIFEIGIFGFILGFITPTALTWVESYLINFSSFFAYSLELFEINVLIVTIIGVILCWWQGAFKNFKQEYLTKGNEHEAVHRPAHHKKSANWWVWALLLVIMLSVFATRLESISTTPTFFEFDPYFDMVDTQYILTYGQELLLDPSAWPASTMGTNHRVEPLIPYIEAYWYDLSNTYGANSSSLSTTLLSLVSGVYPPIAAALLVFVIFVILYHEYNEYIGLIAAALAATMPVLITTFIAGEQLVENWGIFALFFFLAAYMLAVKNPKSVRLAVFAGIAFVSNFLGAHYYTVTAGVLVIYILLQGLIDVIKGQNDIDFYKMNAVVIAVIAIFYVIYLPYSSTLQNRVPTVLGIPIVLSGPILALLLVAFMDYIPKILQKRNIIFKDINLKVRLTWVAIVGVIGILLLLFTPLGAPIQGYLALSTKFTTPSSPLFMTVEEYIPTGLFYNFGAQGFGSIGASIGGFPVLVWLICGLAFVLIALSIIFRNSRTGILYMAMSGALMVAGFSEVKYLPHFAVAYILFFCIILGELIYYAERDFKFGFATKKEIASENTTGLIADPPSKNKHYVQIILAVGIFFVSTIIGIAYLIYLALTEKFEDKNAKTYIYGTLVALVAITALFSITNGAILYGESSSYVDAFSSAFIAAGSTSSVSLCNTLSNDGDDIGYTLYCNTVPQYWLNAMSWLQQNAGPHAPRVLSWWDYGDWINWFGNSNAFLRGDNANATEDYAVAAHYVLQQYTPADLANFMNTNQSKYVLMDEDLISKWQALDFLACIYTNQTSYAYAIAQGQAQNPAVPYVLGTSQCEQEHDPQFALVPLAALIQSNQSSISYYCSMSNATQEYISAPLVVGDNFSNQSVCVDATPNSNGVLKVYQNDKQINAYLSSPNYLGIVDVSGTEFVEYLMIYVPANTNSTNETISDAPSGFYNSNYYKGFILGNLPGFTQVYPANAPGINFINGTYGVRIFALNNFTGSLPLVPPKPSYEHNNYTIP